MSTVEYITNLPENFAPQDIDKIANDHFVKVLVYICKRFGNDIDPISPEWYRHNNNYQLLLTIYNWCSGNHCNYLACSRPDYDSDCRCADSLADSILRALESDLVEFYFDRHDFDNAVINASDKPKFCLSDTPGVFVLSYPGDPIRNVHLLSYRGSDIFDTIVGKEQ